MRCQVTCLAPAHAIGDPVKQTTGVHVTGAGGVDGLDRYTFDRKGLSTMHDQRPFFAKCEGNVFGVLVDLSGAGDRVRPSPAALEHSNELDKKVLADLARIARAGLPVAEQLNYDLFEREYRTRLDAWPFKPVLYSFSHRESLPVANETAELIRFGSVKDYEDWIARLSDSARTSIRTSHSSGKA